MLSIALNSDSLESDVTLPDDYTLEDVLADYSIETVSETAQLARFSDVDSALVGRVRFRETRAGRSSGQAVIRLSLPNKTMSSTWRRLATAMRITGTVEQVEFAAVTAKDAGESDPTDFIAGGARYQGRNWSVTGGDYEVRSSQGLVFDRAYAFRRVTSSTDNTSARLVGLPRNFAENELLRGGALTVRLGKLGGALFVSRNRLDATPAHDSGVSTIVYDGTHSDSGARAVKDFLQEDLAGFSASFQAAGAEVCLSSYANRYDKVFTADSNELGFCGRSLALTGVSMNWLNSERLLRAELAHSWRYGYAGGLSWQGVWDRLKAQFEASYFSRDFYSPHSRSRSLKRKHDDLDAGARVTWRLRDWDLVLDGTTSRDFGLDSMPARLELAASHKTPKFGLVLRWKESYLAESPRTGGTRLDVSYDPNRRIRVSGRFEDRFVWSKMGKRGLMGSLGFRFRNSKCELESRMTHFAVANRSCRVYAYESGFPGNSQSFVGNGWRSYLAGSVKLSHDLYLRGKVGFTAGDSLATAGRQALDFGLSLEASLRD